MIKLIVVSNSDSNTPTVADFAQDFRVEFCCTHNYLYISPSELFKRKRKEKVSICEERREKLLWT